MKTRLASSPPEQIKADAVVFFLSEASEEAPPPGADLNPATDGLVSELYASGEFSGKLFETALLHRPAGFEAQRLLLVGGGPRGELTSSKLRQAAGAALRCAKKKGVRHLALVPPEEQTASATPCRA